MTVISGMRFNGKSGAMVADEQSSTPMKKYDIAKKIHAYSTPDGSVSALVAGTGVSDILYDVKQRIPLSITKHAADVKTGAELANLIGWAMSRVRHEYTDGVLRGRYNFTWEDYLAGYFTTPDKQTRQIDQNHMKNISEMISKNGEIGKALDNSFLMLTSDPSNIELFYANMEHSNAVPCSRPYAADGFGKEAAEDVLYAFFNVRSRDYDTVDPVEGLVALLHATARAGTVHHFIGGIPHISVISDGKVITPNENQSLLASKIVQAGKKGLLKDGFMNGAVDALVFGNADFDATYAQMESTSPDPMKLKHFFLGKRA